LLLIKLTGATTASITNLSKGSYSVMVSDSNTCIFTTTVTISETSVLAATFQTTLPKCYGDKGTSTIYPTGGVFPCTFVWSTNPPVTTQTATNLTNTTFSVTVKDALACSKTFTVSVPSPLPLQNNQPVIVQPTACDEPNGSILINVSGGTQPYNYNWIGYGLTTPEIKNIAQGVYKLQVTDANNCQQVFSTTLTCPTTVDEESKEEAFIMYPNPFTDIVTIESTQGGAYAILNELGQTILSFDLSAANRYTMKADNLRSGVYFVIGITAENKAVRKKLVVLREK